MTSQPTHLSTAMSLHQRRIEASAANWGGTAPESVVVFWRNLGVEDAVDLAGLYTCEDQLRQALQGLQLDEQDFVHAERAWQRARMEAGFVDAMRARVVASAVPDNRPLRPTRTFADVMMHKEKKRRLGVIREDTPNQPDQWADGTSRKREVRETAQQDTLNDLYVVWLALGQNGRKWQHCEPGQEEVRKRLLLRPFQEMENGRLRNLIAGLRRWEKWNAQRNKESSTAIDPLSPDPIRLGEFLEHVATGGDTAAPGVLANLKWWSDHIGIPFPLDSAVIEDFNRVAPRHITCSALALCLLLYFRLVEFARRSSGSVGLFARLLLVVTVACLRFKHAQDSHLIATNERWLKMRCNRGKRKVKGAYPPYDFAVPRILQPRWDLFEPVLALWGQRQRQLNQPIIFIAPDLKINDWERVSEDTPWRAKEMSYDQFNKLGISLLAHLGADKSVLNHKRSLTIPALHAVCYRPSELILRGSSCGQLAGCAQGRTIRRKTQSFLSNA